MVEKLQSSRASWGRLQETFRRIMQGNVSWKFLHRTSNVLAPLARKIDQRKQRSNHRKLNNAAVSGCQSRLVRRLVSLELLGIHHSGDLSVRKPQLRTRVVRQRDKSKRGESELANSAPNQIAKDRRTTTECQILS